MTKEEFRLEWEEEQRLKADYEYALKKLGVGEHMTVREFARALKTLNELGWEVTPQELLQDLKDK
jgi:nucleoid-associated protein YejK